MIFRVERSKATKIFVVLVAVTNCKLPNQLYGKMLMSRRYEFPRADSNGICNDMLCRYGLQVSRNLF